MISAELLNDMREAAWCVVACSGPDTDWMPLLEACPGPKLLVVPDAWVASELERPLQEIGVEVEVQVAWISAHEGEANWYTYNDPRRNGAEPPAGLQERFPNLQLQTMERRPQISLQTLLQSWEPAQRDGGALVWCSNSAEPLLTAEALKTCNVLVVPAIEADATWRAALQPYWLRPDADHTGLWRRDAMAYLKATLQARCDAFTQQVTALQTDRHQLEAEKLELQVRCDELQQNKRAISEVAEEREDRLTKINDELDQILALIESSIEETLN